MLTECLEEMREIKAAVLRQGAQLQQLGDSVHELKACLELLTAHVHDMHSTIVWDHP